MGAYGQVELGWDDWAYLTMTARNDWSSTLPRVTAHSSILV